MRSAPLHRRLMACLRHAWMDARDAHRAVPPAMVERLRQRVAASEQRHTGEVRICVEGSLPRSYLWRHLRRRVPLRTLAQQRALMMFSRLQVWDTEDNNGVLIYLLLAERDIELVADRSLQRHVPEDVWAAMVGRLGDALRAGRLEEGLTAALEEVSAVLVAYFPAEPDGSRDNWLPDSPVLR